MPLRDHFRPPLDDVRSWEELHGQWPAMIVMALARKLPPRYVAGPRVYLGAYFEIDVASPDQDEYEVRVYDTKRHRRLVAAVEIVSPANKDRPEHRQVFVASCAFPDAKPCAVQAAGSGQLRVPFSTDVRDRPAHP